MKLRMDESSKPDLIPAGKYKVKITQSEMRVARNGNNYLYLRVTIDEGAYKGRNVACNIVFRSSVYWQAEKGREQWLQLLNSLEMSSCPHESNLVDKVTVVELTNKERKSGDVFTEVRKFCLPQTAIEIVEMAKESGNKGSASSW